MSSALAEWDRAIRAFEDRVALASTNTSPQEAADLRVTLARMYAERGRPADAIRQLDAASSLEPRRPDGDRLEVPGDREDLVHMGAQELFEVVALGAAGVAFAAEHFRSKAGGQIARNFQVTPLK